MNCVYIGILKDEQYDVKTMVSAANEKEAIALILNKFKSNFNLISKRKTSQFSLLTKNID